MIDAPDTAGSVPNDQFDDLESKSLRDVLETLPPRQAFHNGSRWKSARK